MLGALPLNRRVRTPLRLALSMQYFNTAISFKYSWRLLPIGPWSFGPPTKTIVRGSCANTGESHIINAQQDERDPFVIVTSLTAQTPAKHYLGLRSEIRHIRSQQRPFPSKRSAHLRRSNRPLRERRLR